MYVLGMDYVYELHSFYMVCIMYVPGLESVLRCLTVVTDMKSYDLMEGAYVILSLILKK